MKKFKMVISVILVISISMSLFINSSAQNFVSDTSTMDTENKMILLNRAIEGINDAPKEVVNIIEKNCSLKIDGVEQSTKPLVTTVLISNEKGDLSNQNSIYEATVISPMKIVNDELRTTIYTKTEDVNSSGGEITLYTTIRFEVGDIDGVGYIKLKGVTVDSHSNQSGSKITYVRARFGYRGINYYTRGWENHTSAWYHMAGTDLSIDATCPTIEAIDGGMFYEVWGEGLAHVVRGSSSWDTSHLVRENDMGWYM